MENYEIPTTRLPLSWHPVLASLSDWAADSSPLKLAHIQGPRASGKTLLVPLNLWGRLTSQHSDQLVFLICGPTELARAQRFIIEIAARKPGPRAQFQPAVESYDALLPLICGNLDDNEDDHPWISTEQPDGWRQRRVLPKRVLFIIDVDYDMTAQFCIACVAVSHWAASMSSSSGCKIRVATMSSDGPCEEVVRLFAQVTPVPFDSFRLPAEGSLNPYEHEADIPGLTYYDGKRLPEISAEISIVVPGRRRTGQ